MKRSWLSRRRCLSSLDLSRAFSEGPDGTLLDHLQSCAPCGGQWREMTDLRALSQQLVTDPIDPGRREETRSALLASLDAHRAVDRLPPARSSVRRGWVIVLGSVALAGGVSAWLSWPRMIGQAPAPASRGLATFHARVIAGPDAILQLAGDRWDERVRLQQGRASFEVSTLTPGERFRVVTGDGEIEVRGTSFDVAVEHDHLRRVSVRRGRVDVRREGHALAVLEAGDEWSADQPDTAPRASVAEDAFVAGWVALRAGQFSQASSRFETAARSATDEALAEDAAYWRAVALARASASSASSELADFLRRYPRSAHAEDASIALGWQYLESGSFDRAEPLFRSAMRSRDPQVRASARLGLKRLRAPRH